MFIVFSYDYTGILNTNVQMFKENVQLIEFSLMVRMTHRTRYAAKGKLFFKSSCQKKVS